MFQGVLDGRPFSVRIIKTGRHHLARAWVSEKKQARFHIGKAIEAWPEIRLEILEDDELERLFWEVCGE